MPDVLEMLTAAKQFRSKTGVDPEASVTKPWYSVTNAAGERATIHQSSRMVDTISSANRCTALWRPTSACSPIGAVGTYRPTA